jgi:hypothetical protein
LARGSRTSAASDAWLYGVRQEVPTRRHWFGVLLRYPVGRRLAGCMIALLAMVRRSALLGMALIASLWESETPAY